MLKIGSLKYLIWDEKFSQKETIYDVFSSLGPSTLGFPCFSADAPPGEANLLQALNDNATKRLENSYRRSVRKCHATSCDYYISQQGESKL
jgi:hypothetical protein